MLLIVSIFAVQIVARGNLTLVDGIILIALYRLLCATRAGHP